MIEIEIAVSVLSTLGANSIILFFVKRYFDRRDAAAEESAKARDDLRRRVETCMDTLRLLAYARMSQEIERLLDKGFATPSERRILDEMYHNYKAHGWNGDMDARLEKVYRLRTDHAEGERG